MSGAIVYVDTSTIETGKLEPLKAALNDLAAFVAEHVPRAISYRTYISDDETQMTVVQVHPDAASLEHHLDVAGPRFKRFQELVRLERIEVYGRPTQALLEMLEKKANLLGRGPVRVHQPHAGFERFEGEQVTA